MLAVCRIPILLLCVVTVACRGGDGVRPLHFDDPSLHEQREPLGRSIGQSRIVLLGENGHGVGEFSAAKIKLVEWLYEKHGFDVVAFESGFFECGHAWSRVGEQSAGATLLDCLRYPFQHAELLPLFELIRDKHDSVRPLRLAGVDIQAQGFDSQERPETIRRILAPLDADLAEQVVAADIALFQMEQFGGQGDGLDAWVRDHAVEARALYEAAAEITDGWERQLFRMATGWIDRLEVRARAPADSGRPARYYELRDEWMADAVAALADTIDGQHKVVVWLHNDHARYGNFSMGSDAHRSAGGYLRERFGDAVYSIGFFMGRGTVTDNGRNVRPIASPEPGGVETLLAHAEAPASYLVLRDNRNPAIRRWASGSVSYLRTGTQALTLVPDDEFDALIYIDQVGPPNYEVRR